MKRIFCSVAAGLLTLTTSAQSGHIEFQGKPLTGTLSNFAERMEGHGYDIRHIERVKKSCIKDDIVRNMHSSELNYSAIFESADGTVEVFMELVGGIVLAEERLRVVVVYND